MGTVTKVKETKIKTSNNPTPKNPHDDFVSSNGLPLRELTEKEQEILRRTLISSVTIVYEGELQ